MEAIQLLSSQTGAAQKIQLLSAFLQPQNLDGQSVVFEEERESAGGQINLFFCIFVFFFCIFVFLFLYFLFCVVYFVFRIRGVKRDRGSEVAVREVRSTDTNAPHQLHCWPAQKIKSTDPAIKKGA